MSHRVWAVRAGGESEADALFIESGQLAVSFLSVDRDASALPAQRAAFKDAFAEMLRLRSPAQSRFRRDNCFASFMR